MVLWVLVLNYLNIYQGLSALLINVIAVMALAFVAVSVAAILMPFTRRSIFDACPPMVRARIVGVPVLTIVGVVMLLSWSFVLYVTFATTTFGQISPASMLEAFSVPILGLIYYAGVRLVRARQGIQLATAFREIPPE